MSDINTNLTADLAEITGVEPTATAEVELAATSDPSAGAVGSQSGQTMMLMLALVIVLLALFTLLDRAKMKRTARADKAAAPAARQIPPPTVRVADDDAEIAAVIAAAVSMMTQAEASEAAVADEPPLPTDALRVRRVRRRSVGGAAWSHAGREEQVYSRRV